MVKIDITKTELVWPGKYNEDGTRTEVPRVNLSFQVIETVNESKEGDTFEAGWRNECVAVTNAKLATRAPDKPMKLTVACGACTLERTTQGGPRSEGRSCGTGGDLAFI